MEAFNNLLTAKELSREYGVGRLSAFIDLNLATLYSFYDDPSNTFASSVEAFEETVRTKNWPTATVAFCAIVSPMLNNPQQEAVIRRQLKVWDQCQIPDTVTLAKTCRHKHMAAQAWLDGDYASAITQLQKAKESIDDWSNPDLHRQDCDLFIIDIYRRTGRLDKAISLSKELLAKCDGTYQTWHMGILLQLGELYGVAGQRDSAMFYQDKYIAENDSLMKGQQYGMLRNIEDVVRTLVQERREAEQRHRERMLWIGLCVAVGFILLAGTAATVIAVQRRRLRQNRAALYHRNAEILNLNEHKGQAAAAEDADSALMERATELSTHEEVVCDPKYSIAQMAQRLGVPTRILSKTINAATGENFSVFLAKARSSGCLQTQRPRFRQAHHRGRGSFRGFPLALKLRCGFPSRDGVESQ